jgi:hypothetical protein
MSKMGRTRACRQAASSFGNMREKETQGGCPASNTR